MDCKGHSSFYDKNNHKIDFSKNLFEFERFYSRKYDPIVHQFGNFHGTSYTGRKTCGHDVRVKKHCCCFHRHRGEYGDFRANSRNLNQFYASRLPEFSISYDNHLHTCNGHSCQGTKSYNTEG